VSAARRVWLGTSEGLLLVGLDAGTEVERHFTGDQVNSVAVAAGTVVAAVEGAGVQRRAGDGWEPLGLAAADIWTVSIGDRGEVYAGLEPAALWRLGDGQPSEIDLSKVPNHSFWHSPWGPANVNCVIATEERILIGVEVGGVAASTDRGATWDRRDEGLYEDVHHLSLIHI